MQGVDVAKGGAAGLLSNVPVGEQSLDDIWTQDREFMWIHAPGRMGLDGHEIAHKLSVEDICLKGGYCSQRLCQWPRTRMTCWRHSKQRGQPMKP